MICGLPVLIRNDGEDCIVCESEEEAKELLIEYASMSEELSEMDKQLIASQGFYEGDPDNKLEIVYSVASFR